LQKGGKLGFSGDTENRQDSKREQVLEELRKHFSPEFLNRIDDVIIFDPLTKKKFRRLSTLTIDEINFNALQKNIYLTLNDEAQSYLADKGYSEKYGARPLKRLVQREIEDELAMMLLEKKITQPVEIKIGTEEKDGAKKLSFTFENLSAEKFLEIKGEYFEDQATIDEIWENSILENNEEGEAESQAEPEVTQK
jgi:ATP-dependent Clp protease ATP-binding subunit ClpC